MMTGASYSYAPGGALAICGPRVAALIDLPADAGLVPGLYDLIGSSSGNLDEVLELLVTPGLRAVQNFALAEPTGEGLRVLVRGRYRVEASGNAVEGRGLWTDRIVQADGFSLIDPDSPSSRLALPLPAGVALAGRLTRSPGSVPASSPHPPAPASPQQPSAGSPAVAQPTTPTSVVTPEPAPSLIAESPEQVEADAPRVDGAAEA